MCGILGWIAPVVAGGVNAIKPALATLRARGPDGEGVQSGNNWVLGHTRLAILDTSNRGAQPMTDGAGCWLSYNGEVYNFRELRAELEQRGHRFRSTGDAEVVLGALKEWGAGALPRFRGMFALCFLREATGEVLFARDRFGVKPLVYETRPNELRVASTVSALRAMPEPPAGIDAEAAYLFLAFGYVPAPHTIVRGIKRLMPGHYARATWTVDGVDRFEVRRYWSMSEIPPAGVGSGEAGALGQFRALVARAVDYRLISDVPVGSLLSGGLDSSLVTAIARSLHPQIPSFTMGFDHATCDESRYALQVGEKLGVQTERFSTSAENAASLLDIMSDVYDEPFADPSALPMMSLCRGVAGHVKVALTGDGGDEAQGGYPWHRALAKADRAAAMLGPMRRLGQFGTPLSTPLRYRLAVIAAQDRSARWAVLRTGIDENLQPWLPVEGSGQRQPLADYCRTWAESLSGVSDSVDWACRMDLLTYLPDDLMVKADRASMSVGLELREPMLDQELVAWQLRLPVTQRFERSTRTGKQLTREIVRREIGDVLASRPKQGFTPPVLSWLSGGLKDVAQDAFAALERGGLAPLALPEGCASWAECASRLGDDHGQFSWRILCFYMWHRGQGGHVRH